MLPEAAFILTAEVTVFHHTTDQKPENNLFFPTKIHDSYTKIYESE